MIPILYDKNETTFTSNGLCRLRDAISCVVVEEKNGVYECDFDYPVTGANYDLIQCGRIVGATHEDSEDVQPFEIVSVTRPIDGIVSFHAVHISYRQNQIVASGTNINSLSDAFAMLKAGEPFNPFKYETDMNKTGYMSAADGTPRTARQLLGGVEGSILDTYGGEFEWDKWTVKLWSARGKLRDFAIRYGVNLLDYNDETDCESTFTSCVAYWRGNDGIVSTTASLDRIGYNGNDIRIPLDLTDKFETKPSTAQLEAAALSYMKANQTSAPTRSIKVDFARLSEVGEFEQLESLLTCRLCDSLMVIFPVYDVSETFKVVRTEWDVLADRYKGMELGALRTTLSEALGFQNSPDITPQGIDYIIEEGTDGDWEYRKWNSGIAECWQVWHSGAFAPSGSVGGFYYRVPNAYSLPTGLFSDTPVGHFDLTYWGTGVFWGNVRNVSTTDFRLMLFKNDNTASEGWGSLSFIGRWK